MVCALGDLLLDVVVRVDGPVASDTDTYGRTRVAPGGQAANVAAWAAALGAPARFVGKRARDPAGRILAEELAGRGVEILGPEVEAGTGTVVSLADSRGGRTMLTDRGVAPDLRSDELDPAWLRGCTHFHLPAYGLARAPMRAAALAAARAARDDGARVSVDLSATSVMRAVGVEPFRALLGEIGPETVFGTAEELELVGNVDAPAVVVKRGALGCSLRRGGRSSDRAARATEVVDTTGAGDAFAAGFLVGGVDLALEAAARCVATMGAFPP